VGVVCRCCMSHTHLWMDDGPIRSIDPVPRKLNGSYTIYWSKYCKAGEYRLWYKISQPHISYLLRTNMPTNGTCTYYTRVDDDVKGRHLVAAVDLKAGDLILTERPLLALQSLENLRYQQPCHGCQAFVGGPDAYLQRRLRTALSSSDDSGSGSTETEPKVTVENDNDATDVLESTYTAVPCRCHCGHVYCSSRCEQDTWMAHHAYLCTGDCATVNHPLVQFKQYAVTTNEVLLLVAEWWVAQHVAIAYASHHAQSSHATHTTTPSSSSSSSSSSTTTTPTLANNLALQYTDFIMNPWWDVLTADLVSQPGGFAEANALSQSIRTVCETAATLLNEALQAKAEAAITATATDRVEGVVVAIPPITALDIARRVGACEQNCMGVVQRSPLCRDVFNFELRQRQHAAIVACLLESNILNEDCNNSDEESDYDDDNDNVDTMDSPADTEDPQSLLIQTGVIRDLAPNNNGSDGDIIETDNDDAALDLSVDEVTTILSKLYMQEDYSVRVIGKPVKNKDAMDDDDDNDLDGSAAEQRRIEGDDWDEIFPPLDCLAMYSVLCKMNHSCDPSVVIVYQRQPQWGPDHPLTAFAIALHDLRAGDELTISYIDRHESREERQRALANYGFQCQCRKCQEEDQLDYDNRIYASDATKEASSLFDANDEGLDPETALQRRLERLDTVANHSKFGLIPSRALDAVVNFVTQTANLICTDDRGLVKGSIVSDLLQQCVAGMEQRDYCLCQIVGCDLEETLLDLSEAERAHWPCPAFREAYFCGALTACVGHCHAFHFVAARRIMDRALSLDLPLACVEDFVRFVHDHSSPLLERPYQTDSLA
jgi:SET domain